MRQLTRQKATTNQRESERIVNSNFHTNLNEDMIVAVAMAAQAIANKPENNIGALTEQDLDTHGLCVSAAMLHQLSYKDVYFRTGQ